VHADPALQDQRDAQSLLMTLENEIVPCYYAEGAYAGTADALHAHVPHAWLSRVKHALATLAWRYNADRMVMDYARLAYVPASGTGTAHVVD